MENQTLKITRRKSKEERNFDIKKIFQQKINLLLQIYCREFIRLLINNYYKSLKRVFKNSSLGRDQKPIDKLRNCLKPQSLHRKDILKQTIQPHFKSLSNCLILYSQKYFSSSFDAKKFKISSKKIIWTDLTKFD